MLNPNRNPVDLVKQAAVEAVRALKPVEFRFGTVISVSPLQIRIDQKAPLQAQQLILTRNVTDYEMDIIVDHKTSYESGGGGYSAFSSHAHTYAGKKKITVKNALLAGDEVVLLQLQGGKKFLVLDRMKPNPVIEGESG